jgi:ribonuclease HI
LNPCFILRNMSREDSHSFKLRFHGISVPVPLTDRSATAFTTSSRASTERHYGGGCGYVLLDETGKRVASSGAHLAMNTPPLVAEYRGLIEGLMKARQAVATVAGVGAQNIRIRVEGHAEHVIKQV